MPTFPNHSIFTNDARRKKFVKYTANAFATGLAGASAGVANTLPTKAIWMIFSDSRQLVNKFDWLEITEFGALGGSLLGVSLSLLETVYFEINKSGHHLKPEDFAKQGAFIAFLLGGILGYGILGDQKEDALYWLFPVTAILEAACSVGAFATLFGFFWALFSWAKDILTFDHEERLSLLHSNIPSLPDNITLPNTISLYNIIPPITSSPDTTTVTISKQELLCKLGAISNQSILLPDALSDLECTLSKNLFNQPVIVASGHTFDYDSLYNYVKSIPSNINNSRVKNPITQKYFEKENILPNLNVAKIALFIKYQAASMQDDSDFTFNIHDLPIRYLTCPLSNRVMTNSVVASDGVSYEENELRSLWDLGVAIMGKNNQILYPNVCYPNYVLRSVIDAYKQANTNESKQEEEYYFSCVI